MPEAADRFFQPQGLHRIAREEVGKDNGLVHPDRSQNQNAGSFSVASFILISSSPRRWSGQTRNWTPVIGAFQVIGSNGASNFNKVGMLACKHDCKHTWNKVYCAEAIK
jgi:hypothetical protein